MNTTPILAAGDASRAEPPQRRVVDAPTRMFHALFALSFLGAYLTADGEHWRALHVTLGYTLLGLIVFRVVYGLLGPRQARLGLLWRRVAGLPAWLSRTAKALSERAPLTAPWSQGSSLMIALAAVALLALALPLTLSGWATYTELGPQDLEDVHEFLGETMLMLVLLHIGLVIATSLLKRRNLAMPMITGRQPGRGPDPARHNHGWLAALLLAACVGFIAWQWQQSPEGLLSLQDGSPFTLEHHHDGDDD